MEPTRGPPSVDFSFKGGSGALCPSQLSIFPRLAPGPDNSSGVRVWVGWQPEANSLLPSPFLCILTPSLPGSFLACTPGLGVTLSRSNFLPILPFLKQLQVCFLHQILPHSDSFTSTCCNSPNNGRPTISGPNLGTCKCSLIWKTSLCRCD